MGAHGLPGCVRMYIQTGEPPADIADGDFHNDSFFGQFSKASLFVNILCFVFLLFLWGSFLLKTRGQGKRGHLTKRLTMRCSSGGSLQFLLKVSKSCMYRYFAAVFHLGALLVLMGGFYVL